MLTPGPKTSDGKSTQSTPEASSIREQEDQLIDELAIREFLHTVYPRLVAGIALMTGSRAVAEDAVQEALVRAWDRSERGQSIESLQAWVTTVATNLARSWFRMLRAERRARSRLLTGPSWSPRRGEDRIDIERALAGLPRRQREATVLRYYLGMNTREVASVLKVTEGTVKSTLFRARAALAKALGVQDDEEADDRDTAR